MSNTIHLTSEDWDNFSIFTGFNRHNPVKETTEQDPIITIQRNKAIMSLNKKAYLSLSSPKYVQLSYHKELHLILIRPHETSDKDRIPVRKHPGGGEYISGYSFLKENNIDVSKMRKYKATVRQDKEGRTVLLIDPKDAFFTKEESMEEETKKGKSTDQLEQLSRPDEQSIFKDSQGEKKEEKSQIELSANDKNKLADKLKGDIKSMIVSMGIREDEIDLESTLGNLIKGLQVS